MKKNYKGKRSLVTSDSFKIDIKLNKNYSAMLNYLSIQQRKTTLEYIQDMIKYLYFLENNFNF